MIRFNFIIKFIKLDTKLENQNDSVWFTLTQLCRAVLHGSFKFTYLGGIFNSYYAYENYVRNILCNLISSILGLNI